MSGARWPEIDWRESYYLVEIEPADAGPHWHPDVRWAFEDTPVPDGYTLELKITATTFDTVGQEFGIEVVTTARADKDHREYLRHEAARALKVFFDGP